MIRERPPLRHDAIRVSIYLLGCEERLLGDFMVLGLEKGLDSLGLVSKTPMVKGTELGAAVARAIFAEALHQENYAAACLVTMWICLYGPIDAHSGTSLTMDDLREAVGVGVLAVTVSDDGIQWDYVLHGHHDQCVGGRTIPLDPNLNETGSVN